MRVCVCVYIATRQVLKLIKKKVERNIRVYIIYIFAFNIERKGGGNQVHVGPPKSDVDPAQRGREKSK